VEELSVTLDGVPLAPVEHVTPAGGRLHALRVGAGRLEVRYRAEVAGRSAPVAAEPLDASTYLRPSRYAESDRLAAVATQVNMIVEAELRRERKLKERRQKEAEMKRLKNIKRQEVFEFL
jgi:hypothetical protein